MPSVAHPQSRCHHSTRPDPPSSVTSPGCSLTRTSGSMRFPSKPQAPTTAPKALRLAFVARLTTAPSPPDSRRSPGCTVDMGRSACRRPRMLRCGATPACERHVHPVRHIRARDASLLTAWWRWTTRTWCRVRGRYPNSAFARGRKQSGVPSLPGVNSANWQPEER